ncbi:hypothetical protein VULLAG_LOCUS1239 [Vulpes lagopus]
MSLLPGVEGGRGKPGVAAWALRGDLPVAPASRAAGDDRRDPPRQQTQRPAQPPPVRGGSRRTRALPRGPGSGAEAGGAAARVRAPEAPAGHVTTARGAGRAVPRGGGGGESNGGRGRLRGGCAAGAAAEAAAAEPPAGSRPPAARAGPPVAVRSLWPRGTQALPAMLSPVL